MKKAQSLQLMHQSPKAIFNGLFAWGVLTDYRADWALANILEQPENVNTIQRNPG